MTKAVTSRWFEALGRGDGEAALACLDDNVHWINSPDQEGGSGGVPGLSAIVPWLGDFPNKAAVVQSFVVWANLSQVLHFELRDLLIKEDEAMAVIHEVATIKATGLNYDIEFIQRIRVANDRIVFWKSYWDTSKGIVPFRGDMKARLLAAAKRHDPAEADLVLPFGANPNTTEDGTGQTVLMLAAARGDATMVGKLLASGADPNLLDRHAGATALHKACQGRHLECVRLLVEGGALIDIQAASTGHTPLLEAIWFTADAIVEYLLDQNARIERTTFYGFTLDEHLDIAMRVNRSEAAQAALSRIKGLVQARRDRDAAALENPLFAAARKGDLAAAQAAIAAGADLEARHPVVGEFDDGHTALIIAARENQLEIVNALIAAGADVNAVEPVFGAVPLHKSTYFGWEAVTEALAKAPGIQLDYQGPDNGYTPLHDALWHGFPACARLLLAAGARKDIVAYDGLYPVDIARRVMPDDPIVNDLKL